MLFRKKQLEEIVKELFGSKRLLYFAGTMSLLFGLYPNNLKNWNFGCAKTPGLIDRKPTSVDFSQLSDNPSKTRHWRLFEERCHISNMGSFTIDQSREFSHQPKSNSSGCLGIIIVIAHPIWEWSWRGLITLIGYLAILKGVVRMGFVDQEGY